jgi:hypothetical protein
MSRPRWEVADVLRRFGAEFYKEFPQSAHVQRTLSALERCRTALLGGHVESCDTCGAIRIAYNSCRNRHCPKCQAIEREAWILARESELLPVRYFHVVFTLPAQLNVLAIHEPALCYDLLFDSAWETMQTFARDPKHLGAQTGMTAVLHTWGQNLSLHPHVHCIVPGGGLTKSNQWQNAGRGSERFLFPVKAMSRVYRAIYLRKLRWHLQHHALDLPIEISTKAEQKTWMETMYRQKWVVYAKRPFGGPKQVIEYLGRYTHKVAISNHRLLDISEPGVRFAYKDYRHAGTKKEMTLSGPEFLRRFAQHILPPGFRRMRHFGILANSTKRCALAACRIALGVVSAPDVCAPSRAERRRLARIKLIGNQSTQICPCCKTGHMHSIGIIPPQRAPPAGAVPRFYPMEFDL